MRSRWPGWLLIWCLPTLVALLAWQSGTYAHIDIGGDDDSDYLLGFYAPEHGAFGSYRWSSADAMLLLPAYPLPGLIELRGSVAPNGTLITLGDNQGPVVTLPPRVGPPELRRYRIYWPARADVFSWSPLSIHAATPEAQAGSRPLGMMVSQVRMQSMPRFGLPPLLPLATLAVLPLPLWWFWRQCGMRGYLARLLAIVSGAALALAWGLRPWWFYQYYLAGILALLVLSAILCWMRTGDPLPRRRAAVVLAVFGLALALRLYAASRLETHWDEDDYLRAGQLYAQHLAEGDLAAIVNERVNYEHPPLSKLAFGAVLYTTQLPPRYRETISLANHRPSVALQARPLREFSGLWGALTAALVAAASPVAGLLIAVSSWHASFTSLAMLESLPCFFSALALLSLRRSVVVADRWWWLAAGALGVAGAGKYLYAVPFGAAALIWMLWRRPRAWPWALGWGGLALLTFFLADPALWPDPPGRLYASLSFNTGYASSDYITTYGYHWYQPLYWLLTPLNESRGVFPLLLDGGVAVCALLALGQLWRYDRLLLLWFTAGLIFLLIWPTKWDHYILIVTVPVALMAATFLQATWARLKAFR